MASLPKFQAALQNAKNVVFLTGAGVSAESGVPTFRGAGGLWRQFDVTQLATPTAFKRDPSLVWEFYHYRRTVMATKKPNPAHYAIARFQKKFPDRVTLVTQNIDRLHHAAGSSDVIEMHGSLWLTRCLRCAVVEENRTNPITPALEGKGDPSGAEKKGSLKEADLPHCSCGGLLRPHVVWFEESLDPLIMEKIYASLDSCDLLVVVGTSAVVYPAASFVPYVKNRGGLVAEFNLEETKNTSLADFTFHGQCGLILPEALGVQGD